MKLGSREFHQEQSQRPAALFPRLQRVVDAIVAALASKQTPKSSPEWLGRLQSLRGCLTWPGPPVWGS
jgi:hypothetical protein